LVEASLEARPKPCFPFLFSRRGILPLAKKGAVEPRTAVRGKKREMVGREGAIRELSSRRPHR